MKFYLWILWRQFLSKKLGLTGFLAILAMALGVAALVISMAVISSYTSALRSTVVDTFGDILVLHSGAKLSNRKELISKIEKLGGEIESYTSFVSLEAIAASQGIVSGVLLQGMEELSMKKVLNLSSRIIKGELRLNSRSGTPLAVIGSRFAKKMKISVGDEFSIVVPYTKNKDHFYPRLQTFKVSGIVSYGRFDYDTRYIMISLPASQNFLDKKDKISGFRIKLKDSFQADKLSERINQNNLDPLFWSLSWKKINNNLFAAAEYEKIIIFFILLIIVIAASFNIASVLFVHVFLKIQDISVLKVLGASQKMIRRIFILQGLFLGLSGYIVGLTLGLSLYWIFIKVQNYWHILDAQVYKLEELSFHPEFFDLSIILLASMIICYISTLVPSKRGSELSPAKGLRYE